MKKVILFALCIMLGSLLLAQTTVSRTVTIDSLTLEDTRSSTNSSSEYWDAFLNGLRSSTTEAEYLDPPPPEPIRYVPGPDYNMISRVEAGALILPPSSNRACGFPAHGFPTKFVVCFRS